MDYAFLNEIDEKKEFLDAVADEIWEHPELAFEEYHSAACLCDALRREGFAVETGLAGIETAFSATFGSGRPVIGILGEFDALSGLGQKAFETHSEPNGKAAGHGCGHNLLGTGSLAAAIAVKRWLEERPGKGTVIYFGCPGEEGGSGKAFMARDGVFDGLDAAFYWHPDEETYVRTNKSLANIQVRFVFDGIASHAGAEPELGRSALDAVELMNVGVNYLREHMIDDARVHYAVTDTGGISPNVVQKHAEVLYLIRAPRNDQASSIYERVCKIAQGAALMTETKESHVFIKACSNTVINGPMTQMLQKIMEELDPPEPTEADIAFARKMSEDALSDFPKTDPEHPIHWELLPYRADQHSDAGHRNSRPFLADQRAGKDSVGT